MNCELSNVYNANNMASFQLLMLHVMLHVLLLVTCSSHSDQSVSLLSIYSFGNWLCKQGWFLGV